MIDTNTEQLLPLSALAGEITNRNGGKGINVATIWRWCMRGCKGIKLESTLCGGIRMSSREARDRFFARLTAAANGESAPVPTDRLRAKAIAAANRDLDAAGI